MGLIRNIGKALGNRPKGSAGITPASERRHSSRAWSRAWSRSSSRALSDSPISTEHAAIHAQIRGALDRIKGSNGLYGISLATDLLNIQSTETAREIFTRAAHQFEVSAIFVRNILSDANTCIDQLPQAERENHVAPLSAALNEHARQLSRFSSAALDFISHKLALEVPSPVVHDNLRLQLKKVVERARDIHVPLERRLSSWKGEIERMDAIESALGSGPTDLTSSTVVSYVVEKSYLAISLRRAGLTSARAPEILLTVNAAQGAEKIAGRCVEDIRAILAAGADLFGVNGEIKDLAMLQELTHLGRVSALNLVITKRIAGQVMNSIDFRGCRFEDCNLRAADFSGSTFDHATEFVRCRGIEHARFDAYLELDGISTIPTAFFKRPSGVLSRVRSAVHGYLNPARALTADDALAEVRDSEHFQSRFQLTDFTGLPVARDGRKTDSITIHFSGGCVMLSKVAGASTHLKAEVFQLVGEVYEAIAPGNGKTEDSPIYQASADQVLQWTADVCNQYPLTSSTLSARADRFRKHSQRFAVAA